MTFQTVKNAQNRQIMLIFILPLLLLCIKGDYEKSKYLFEPFIIDGIDIRYSQVFFNRSILNFGQLSLNTTLKMNRGECLNILNIGGSVSCGMSLNANHYDNPHGKNGAYSTFLEKYLNTMWPCMRDHKNSKHKVTNWCVGGRPTVSWVDEVVGSRMNEPHVLFNADIILVDTSVNDMNEGRDQAVRAKEDPDSHLKKVTELFIKILSKLPQGPSIIYVGSSTRVHGQHTTWRSTGPRTGDSVYTHLPVTNYYHVPYVSIIDSMTPFLTEESQKWFTNVFLADYCCHPTKSGHRMVAAIIYNILQSHRDAAVGDDDEYIHNAHINYYDKPPLCASLELINQYAISLPLAIHLNTHEIHKSTTTPTTTTTTTNTTTNSNITITSDSHWAVYEDRPGKPGFISSTVGSTFQVSISKSIVYTHLKSGHIHIELLKSYEHVGRVNVSIGIQSNTIHYTNNTTDTTDTTHSTTSSSTSVYHKLDERVVDCIWLDKSSQRSVEEFHINLGQVNTYMSPTTTAAAATPITTTATSTSSASSSISTACLLLSFTVIDSIPIRKNNKIKMFSILLM